jgi:hypothetical protein
VTLGGGLSGSGKSGKDISADVIAGAIVAYLLMAVMWSKLYVVLETTPPGSFNFPAEVHESQQSLLRYFSGDWSFPTGRD